MGQANYRNGPAVIRRLVASPPLIESRFRDEVYFYFIFTILFCFIKSYFPLSRLDPTGDQNAHEAVQKGGRRSIRIGF
jgi:hypothetical protein